MSTDGSILFWEYWIYVFVHFLFIFIGFASYLGTEIQKLISLNLLTQVSLIYAYFSSLFKGIGLPMKLGGTDKDKGGRKCEQENSFLAGQCHSLS